MTGKIIKGIAGFYYVHVVDKGIYECKAKGIFRNKNIKPLVGDNVDIDIIDEEAMKGNINNILPRKNELIRPAVANVDQALVIFAVTNPKPNFNLLDRFIVMMDKYDIKTVICFSKKDLATDEQILKINEIYEKCGCEVHFISTKENIGIEDVLIPLLKGKTTVLAGPSGVGKSTLTNELTKNAPDIQTFMEVGDVSAKIGRGRHTTRHTEILNIEHDTYILDTPGFTSFYVTDMEPNELRYYFREFESLEGKCRFSGCVHINEPDCKVKLSVEAGDISKIRYENYIELYNELKDKKKY